MKSRDVLIIIIHARAIPSRHTVYYYVILCVDVRSSPSPPPTGQRAYIIYVKALCSPTVRAKKCNFSLSLSHSPCVCVFICSLASGLVDTTFNQVFFCFVLLFSVLFFRPESLYYHFKNERTNGRRKKKKQSHSAAYVNQCLMGCVRKQTSDKYYVYILSPTRRRATLRAATL